MDGLMTDPTPDPVVELEKTHKQKARIAFSILLAVYLAVCAFLATAGDLLMESNDWIGLIFGLFFGQCSLLAVWAALGSQKIIHRISITLFLLGLLALAFSNMVMEDVSDITHTLLFSGVLLLQWFVIQTPLWAIRVIRKTQLVLPGQELSPVIRDDFRFSLKQIMIWTAAVAVLLGMGRVIFSAVETSDFDFSRVGELIAALLFFLFFNALISLITIWGALSRWKPLVCLFLSVVAVLITGVAEALLFVHIESLEPQFEIFMPMTMAHFALLAGSLLLLRFSGFRLASLRNPLSPQAA